MKTFALALAAGALLLGGRLVAAPVQDADTAQPVVDEATVIAAQLPAYPLKTW